MTAFRLLRVLFCYKPYLIFHDFVAHTYHVSISYGNLTFHLSPFPICRAHIMYCMSAHRCAVLELDSEGTLKVIRLELRTEGCESRSYEATKLTVWTTAVKPRVGHSVLVLFYLWLALLVDSLSKMLCCGLLHVNSRRPF